MPEPLDSGRALASLVRSEATRMLSDQQLAADPILLAQGWQRRFVTDMNRAAEVADLYRQLGFEIRLEPIPQEQFGEHCDACQLAMLLRFRTIYTKKVRSEK